jgi:glutamyl-tRNA synthetase
MFYQSIMKIIRNLVLQNAVKFEGKASLGAVIGHIISNDPKSKENIKSIAKEVNAIIKEVNNLSLEDQKRELEKNAPELLIEKKHEKKEGLKDLPNVGKKIIMRFAPSPSGPMHIGHAYGISLSSEYCRKYKGKLIFRIEDTNPDNIYKPAYDLLKIDANWITKNNVEEFIIQSDRLELYYKYALDLFNKNALYVCTCDSEIFKKLRDNKKACPCRSLKKEEQIDRWNKMLDNTFKQGDCVVRVKTEIDHKNPAIRDYPVFRINESEHPRQITRYRVWPLMNFSVAIDDIESGMTHIIRAKEHADNAKRQKYIYDYLGKKFPEILFVGRINFIGMPVSCSKTKAEIEKGTYKGWDDIRLPFLLALRRRGYQPEAFIKYAMEVGVSLTDKTVSKEDFFKSINSFNRELIDKKANRYFFIENPKKIKIKNSLEKEVKIELYPNDPERGFRTFKISEKFYIQDKIEKNKNYRLMHLFNFSDNNFISEDIDEKLNALMIHWLPVCEDLVNVEVLMEDNTIKRGLGESGLKNIKVGDIVQFERNFFARLDEIKKDKLVFWYTHK